MSDTPPQPNTADVMEFLQKEADPTGATPTVVALHIDDAARADIEASRQQAPEEEQRISVPINAAFDPEASNLEQMLTWIFQSQALNMKIEVTEHEKSVYFKTFLTDEKVVFDIIFEMAKDVVVRCQSLTALEQDLIGAALKLDDLEGLTPGPESYISAFQQYCISLQVLALDGIPFNFFTGHCEISSITRKVVDEFRQFTKDALKKLPASKLALLVKAVTIFEIKHKICNDNVGNKVFWCPPDSK